LIEESTRQKYDLACTYLKSRQTSAAHNLFLELADNEQKKGSDIDILIEIPKNIKFSLLDFIGLKLELEDALNLKVDLVEYKTIKPIIKNTILNEEIRII
jgi:predicted nucleotidyltransferase